jgi:probable rRNA maturation factor
MSAMNNNHLIEIIQQCAKQLVCTQDDMAQLLHTVLVHERMDNKAQYELHVHAVTTDEIQALNMQTRSKDKPTNVLSFPYQGPKQEQPIFMGDIVICPDIIASEADNQGKPEKRHCTHLLIHSMLHLLGYDHETSTTAEEMEAKEIAILNKLQHPNPYEDTAL